MIKFGAKLNTLRFVCVLILFASRRIFEILGINLASKENLAR